MEPIPERFGSLSAIRLLRRAFEALVFLVDLALVLAVFVALVIERSISSSDSGQNWPGEPIRGIPSAVPGQNLRNVPVSDPAFAPEIVQESNPDNPHQSECEGIAVDPS